MKQHQIDSDMIHSRFASPPLPPPEVNSNFQENMFYTSLIKFLLKMQTWMERINLNLKMEFKIYCIDIIVHSSLSSLRIIYCLHCLNFIVLLLFILVHSVLSFANTFIALQVTGYLSSHDLIHLIVQRLIIFL